MSASLTARLARFVRSPASSTAASAAAISEGAAWPRSATPFLFGYVRQRPLHFATLLALMVAASSCAVGVQYGMKLIVDEMALGQPQSPAIWRWLVLFISLIAVESVLWRLGGWLGCNTVVATGVDVRLDLFRRLTGHPMHYFSDKMSGALGNRITATSAAVASLLGTLTWHIVPPCVDFIGALVVLVSIDVRLAVALIAFACLVAGIIGAFGARGRPLHRAWAEQASKVNGEVVDTVANIWTVKAFSARDREYGRLRQAFGLEAKAHRRSWLYTEKARMLHDLCLWIMAGGMLAWAIHGWRHGGRTPGDVVVISALTFRILHGSRDLALSLVEAMQQVGVINEMLSVLGQAPLVADKPGAKPFVPGHGHIRLSKVSFGYGEGQPLFDELDLDIPAGQRLGIVGPSGGGKSTLIGLIQRLGDVQSGRIEIDGQDVTTVNQDSLRESIAVVPQEIALFHRTVCENLRYGRPQASNAQVMAAAAHAECDRFIEALPLGYDTLVGERGVRLSGGQRQRIGIARAFLKDAPIILLDEATSALDSTSEAEIQHALTTLMQGRTVIAVAHRLSTVASFDRIVVIEEGKIVEDGPPAELLAREGIYAKLWTMQSQGLETA